MACISYKTATSRYTHTHTCSKRIYVHGRLLYKNTSKNETLSCTICQSGRSVSQQLLPHFHNHRITSLYPTTDLPSSSLLSHPTETVRQPTADQRSSLTLYTRGTCDREIPVEPGTSCFAALQGGSAGHGLESWGGLQRAPVVGHR